MTKCTEWGDTILVKERNIFGEDKIYPVCSQAKLFANLAGTKTITLDAQRIIKDAGFTIKTQGRTL
jgi:hypothetical protein